MCLYINILTNTNEENRRLIQPIFNSISGSASDKFEVVLTAFSTSKTFLLAIREWQYI